MPGWIAPDCPLARQRSHHHHPLSSPPPPALSLQALRKPWRQQLVQELNFGQRVTPSSLSHLVSAQQLAAEEGL